MYSSLYVVLITLLFRCATHWKITNFYMSTLFFLTLVCLEAHDGQFFPPCFLFSALLWCHSLLNVLSLIICFYQNAMFYKQIYPLFCTKWLPITITLLLPVLINSSSFRMVKRQSCQDCNWFFRSLHMWNHRPMVLILPAKCLSLLFYIQALKFQFLF